MSEFKHCLIDIKGSSGRKNYTNKTSKAHYDPIASIYVVNRIHAFLCV